MGSFSQKIFCAFCRLERRIILKKSVDWTNVGLAFFASGLLMFAIWQDVDPRGVIFFVIFVAMAEIFARLRWRMGLPCPHCGFDPLLYKTNRDEAVQRVRARLQAVRLSGRYLLKQTNPFLNLPTVVAKNEMKERPRHLSRDV